MSFWRHYYHIVWATKAREPLVTAEVEARLYGFLVRRASELEVRIHAINGVADHLHIVASIPPKCAVSDLVKRLKGASAHFVNHVIQPEQQFVWQRGFGSLPLGESRLTFAVRYVEEQKIRHAGQDLNTWLEKAAEFDEGPDDAAHHGPRTLREAASIDEIPDHPPL